MPAGLRRELSAQQVTDQLMNGANGRNVDSEDVESGIDLIAGADTCRHVQKCHPTSFKRHKRRRATRSDVFLSLEDRRTSSRDSDQLIRFPYRSWLHGCCIRQPCRLLYRCSNWHLYHSRDIYYRLHWACYKVRGLVMG